LGSHQAFTKVLDFYNSLSRDAFSVFLPCLFGPFPSKSAQIESTAKVTEKTPNAEVRCG
jgi:hypothetical protein